MDLYNRHPVTPEPLDKEVDFQESILSGLPRALAVLKQNMVCGEPKLEFEAAKMLISLYIKTEARKEQSLDETLNSILFKAGKKINDQGESL
jgi:hypothetical protein